MEKIKKDKYYYITLTSIIIAINVLVFYFEYKKFGTALIGGTVSGQQMLLIGGDQGTLTWASGEFWRAITALFIHASPSHILSNMLTLLFVGPILETRAGKFRYTIIYFLAGISGSFANWMTAPNTVTVGASGAIYGILGALLVLTFIRNKTFTPKAFYWVLFIVISNLIYSVMDPQVSLASHVGGLTMGVALMLIFLIADHYQRLIAYSNHVSKIEHDVKVKRENEKD